MTTETSATRAAGALDPKRLRADFPGLSQTVKGRPLVYLDSAASAQKPRQVIDTLSEFYATSYANVHRAVHSLGGRATEAYEGAREKLRGLVGAAESREIVFTRGATESINLVAQAFARPRLEPGDEILLSELEHHSNLVPWQMVARQTGARLKFIPMNDRGELVLDDLDALLGPRVKMLSVGHVSNALGTVNPLAEILPAARERGIPTLVDGAQAVPHLPVDLAALGCDFYAFSGHKLYGPTGIGVLYGRAEHLEEMEPWQGGGDMILNVTLEDAIWNDIPWKFEAGTPHIAGAVGLGAAADYVSAIGLDAIHAYGKLLMAYATERLSELPELRIIGEAREKIGAISFLLGDVHPHDLGTILDSEGVAVRAGHHCAQPVMEHFGIAGTTRASFSFYNTREDVDTLVAALAKAKELFS